MKRKRHSPEQIIRKLREANAMLAGEKTIGQDRQVLEVSEQTFHGCDDHFSGPPKIET
jgi:putative transposase